MENLFNERIRYMNGMESLLTHILWFCAMKIVLDAVITISLSLHPYYLQPNWSDSIEICLLSRVLREKSKRTSFTIKMYHFIADNINIFINLTETSGRYVIMFNKGIEMFQSIDSSNMDDIIFECTLYCQKWITFCYEFVRSMK